MDRIIDEGCDWLALRTHCLYDAHAAIVQVRRVIVVGDLSLCLARGNLERRGLELIDGRIDRFGRPFAYEVHILEIARMASLETRKCVTVGSAMGVSRSDQNVLWRNPAHFGADSVAQRGGEAKRVKCDHRDGHFA